MPTTPNAEREPARRIRDAGVRGERWYRAPGRVNLMGDHTDYNDGFVLPMAVDRECVIAALERDDGVVRVTSLDPDDGDPATVEVPADGSAAPDDVDGEWGRYVAALVRSLAERGRRPVGVEAALASSVPSGAGLSSSAALEVAVALALAGAGGLELDAAALAVACQDAEREATGVAAGVMDQLISLAGRAGSAALIDCRSLAHEPVPLPDAAGVLVVHSGQRRRLAGSEYAARRRECERIAAELGVAALRDATAEQVRELPLARHVVAENRRVGETAAALRAGDLERAGALFTESHRSLRDDYRVSTPQVDALVEALVAEGAFGARVTGAGFGGCVVALTEAAEAEAIGERAAARYRQRSGLEPIAFVCEAADGAGPL